LAEKNFFRFFVSSQKKKKKLKNEQGAFLASGQWEKRLDMKKWRDRERERQRRRKREGERGRDLEKDS
jgi:hypothetical protein